MEVTKREVIVSISIFAILLIIGFVLGGKIEDYQADLNAKYNKALKIDSKEIFDYGMKTSVGDAFVYGTIEAKDTVSYEDIKGEYIYIEKVKERYTRHTRTVKSGKTTRTEVYYTWDVVDRESKTCKEVTLLDNVFKTSKFDFDNDEYIDTVKRGYNTRYKYYAVPKKFKASIFTSLRNNDIGKDIDVYDNMTIKETKEYLQTNFPLIIFWIVWILVIIGSMVGYCYLDNDWLNRN